MVSLLNDVHPARIGFEHYGYLVPIKVTLVEKEYNKKKWGPVTRFANNNDYDNWAGSGLGSSMSFNEYCRQNGLACGPGF